MRRILSTIIAIFVSVIILGQTKGDNITIYKTDGTSQSYNLFGTNNAISSIQHDDGKMQIYLKGWEDFGPWEEINTYDIRNVIFSIYHESDVSDITLSDQGATDATKRLYKYLKLNYGSKIFSSAIADVNWNNNMADKVYSYTGKYPAINCYDFIHIYTPNNNGWINYNDLTPVTTWSEAGGIVSLMWHFNVPKTETTVIGSDGSGVTCTPSETTFKASNALIDGTWENKWFYSQMDKVVSVLLQLQNKGISAIWRPFHEAAGNATRTKGDWTGTAWFWWGEDGPETYKNIWKAMFSYFQTKGVHNLIWNWTTQNYNGDETAYDNDALWYPGDEYVDIIGRDLYGSTAEENATEFAQIKARYGNKLINLSECGNNNGSSFSTIPDLWTAGAKWLSFMPWYGINFPNESWWTTAMSQKYVITRDQVNVNATYVEESASDAVKNMGLGWCLGNTFDSFSIGLGNNKSPNVYETVWGQPLTTQDMMHFLKEGGFNSVRIPITWFQKLDSENNINQAWMDRIQEVVDYVIKEDMYCIINMHHDTGAGDDHWMKADVDNYNANNQKYKKIWEQIATRFADYNHHLLFESYNELLDKDNTWNGPKKTDSYTYLNKYAQDFVNTVRATGGNNASRNLIVNTYAAANNQDVIDHFKVPTDNIDGHIAVEVHSYDPYNWINKYGEWNSTCSNEIKNMFNRLNTAFVSKGIPVVLGEYGTHGDNASVNGSSTNAWKKAAADQAADIVKQAKSLGISTFYWMSIFDGTDRTNLKWTLPETVEAMKKAYNDK